MFLYGWLIFVMIFLLETCPCFDAWLHWWWFLTWMKLVPSLHDYHLICSVYVVDYLMFVSDDGFILYSVLIVWFYVCRRIVLEPLSSFVCLVTNTCNVSLIYPFCAAIFPSCTSRMGFSHWYSELWDITVYWKQSGSGSRASSSCWIQKAVAETRRLCCRPLFRRVWNIWIGGN